MPEILLSPDQGGQICRDRFLVLGLGNTLLGDDGAGVQVVRNLQRKNGMPRGTRLLDGGTLSFSLLEDIEDAGALIVVDAAQLGEAPGTVHVFREEAMDRFLRSRRTTSVHEVSLMELLDMARLNDRLPQRRALVGIQPAMIDWGTEVSESVAEGLEVAGQHVRALLARYSI